MTGGACGLVAGSKPGLSVAARRGGDGWLQGCPGFFQPHAAGCPGSNWLLQGCLDFQLAAARLPAPHCRLSPPWFRPTLPPPLLQGTPPAARRLRQRWRPGRPGRTARRGSRAQRCVPARLPPLLVPPACSGGRGGVGRAAAVCRWRPLVRLRHSHHVLLPAEVWAAETQQSGNRGGKAWKGKFKL